MKNPVLLILSASQYLCGKILGHSFLKLHKNRTKPQRMICSRCGYTYTVMTLVDYARTMDIEGMVASIVEMLGQPNEILEDLGRK